MSSTNPSSPLPDAVDWASAGLCYHSLNFFCHKKFGHKVRKLSLDAGCTCPNRDGTLATLGCIFCEPESFSPSRRMGTVSVADQIQEGIGRLGRRYGATRLVAYFQPGTNTYGPIDRLRSAYQQALAYPEIVGIAIGTRPDCANEEVLDLLTEMAAKTWVVVEYGVQTIHDRTLDLLNRGHHYDAFLDAYRRTRSRNLDIAVHVILGLPGESRDDMTATARALARLQIFAVKLHNLYAVRNTVLAGQVAAGQVRLPEFDDYVGWAVDFLEELPGGVVIDRLSGDAPPEYLLGPQWCLDKAAVRAAIDAEFRRRGTHQGSRTVAFEPK
jgi:radical SAM protein (TIGR01212 family)